MHTALPTTGSQGASREGPISTLAAYNIKRSLEVSSIAIDLSGQSQLKEKKL